MAQNIKMHPALTINKQLYKGQFDPQDLTHAICAGFLERPAHCRRDYIKDYLNDREKWNIPEYGNPIATEILYIGVLICIVNCGVLYYCKKKSSSSMVQSEVNTAV